MTWSSDTVETLVDGNNFENGRAIFGGLAGADNRGNVISNNKGIGATLYAVEGRDDVGIASDPHFGSLDLIGNRFESCGPIEFANPNGSAASELAGHASRPHRHPRQRVHQHPNQPPPKPRASHCTNNHLEWTTTLVAGTGLIEVNRCVNAKVRNNTIIGGAYGIAVTSTAPAGSKWFRSVGIDVASGNTCHNQNLGGIMTWNAVGYAHRSCRLHDNLVTTDTAQNADYAAITATSGVTVNLNTIDTANGRGVVCGGDATASPVGIPGTVVKHNTIRTVSDSVRINGGSINNVVRFNEVVTAVSDASGGGNTVSDNDTLAA